MNRQALVVGINRYRYLKPHLQLAARDAEEIAFVLRKYGHFQVKVLPETYQDGALRVAENNGFVDEIRLKSEISKLFNPGEHYPETALLFFAGHGLYQSLESNQFKAYLAPGDADPKKGKWGIPFDWLRDTLINSPIPNQIVWLDCCHSGEFTNLTFDQTNAENRGLINVNRSFIAACRNFEQAQEFEDHGLLTSLLLRGLNPYQEPQGTWINSKNLDAFINDELRNDAKLSTFRQRFRTNSPGEPINFWQKLGAINPSRSEGKTEGVVSPSQPPIKPKKVVGIETIQAVPVWVGRDELLQQLKDKLLTPETPLKVLVLVGQGGIGKTSLAVKLLEALGANLTTATLNEDSAYNCAICFKAEKGTSFDDVASVLLRSLDIEVSESVKKEEEKIHLILTGLRQQRSIILLDNLETILHPGSHPLAGKAKTPEWSKLLNALVYSNHCSQVILTSRERPIDLADLRYPESKPDTDLVAIETVSGVSVTAAMEILRRKLTDSEEDLRWMAERVEGHLFLLTQLVSLGNGQPGYLRKNPQLVTRNAKPMLREQLARLSEAGRDLLRPMCVLRVGIDIGGLTFLRLYTDNREKDNRLIEQSQLGKPIEFSEIEISATQKNIDQLLDSNLVLSRYDNQ